MSSPADSPQPEGPLVVGVTTHEILGIAKGDAIMVSTLDGQRVQLRLLTPEELMEQQRQALASLPPGGPPPMTYQQAAALVRPLPS